MNTMIYLATLEEDSLFKNLNKDQIYIVMLFKTTHRFIIKYSEHFASNMPCTITKNVLSPQVSLFSLLVTDGSQCYYRNRLIFLMSQFNRLQNLTVAAHPCHTICTKKTFSKTQNSAVRLLDKTSLTVETGKKLNVDMLKGWGKLHPEIYSSVNGYIFKRCTPFSTTLVSMQYTKTGSFWPLLKSALNMEPSKNPLTIYILK